MIKSCSQESRYGGVAQVVRACGSYPQCHWFESSRRYHTKLQRHQGLPGGAFSFALARLSLPRTVLFDSEKMHRLTATPGVDIQGSTGPIHVRKGIDDGIAVVEWSARCLLCSETETLLWQAARSGEAFGGSCPVNVV